ncbi:MAG: diacylglycerol/lipid kinase family protein [Bulleidia sp.]
MKKVLFLMNMEAGIGNAAETLPQILQKLVQADCEVTVYPILYKDGLDTRTILEKTKDRFDRILIAGGDGTLNHLIDAMMRTEYDRPYAFLPFGSCNDFSRSIYHGKEPDIADVCEAIVKGEPFRYDIGMFNARYFNYIAAFGAFTNVSYTTSQAWKNLLGYGAYAARVLSDLPDGLNTRVRMRLECDDQIIQGDYILGGICNTRSVAGVRPPMLADARLNDGKMELLLIDVPKDLFEMNGIFTALRNKNIRNPHIHILQGSHFHFAFDQETSWTLDGEEGGKVKEAVIHIVSNRVAVLLP